MRLSKPLYLSGTYQSLSTNNNNNNDSDNDDNTDNINNKQKTQPIKKRPLQFEQKNNRFTTRPFKLWDYLCTPEVFSLIFLLTIASVVGVISIFHFHNKTNNSQSNLRGNYTNTTYSAIIIPNHKLNSDRLIAHISEFNSLHNAKLSHNILIDAISVEIISMSQLYLSSFVANYQYDSDFKMLVDLNGDIAFSHYDKPNKPNVPVDPADVDYGFAPNYVSNLYGFPPASTINTPTSIGVIGLGGIVNIQEIKKYWFSVCKIPYADQPTITIVSGDGSSTYFDYTVGYNFENTMDVEIIGCVVPSPQLTIVVYHSNNNILSLYKTYLTILYDTVHAPKIISTSWGIPEEFLGHKVAHIFDDIFQFFVHNGITFVAASGDSASSDGIVDSGFHVDFPASSPNVIGVGGTTLNVNSIETGSPQLYSETAWSFNISYNTGGGGGYSTIFSVPEFQTHVHNSLYRGVPDLAINANPQSGIEVLFNGVSGKFGGTSIAAPMFASFLILNNVKSFVLPTFYANTQAFNKITSGTNGHYTIGTNAETVNGNATHNIVYDVVCGLGSIKGSVLSTILQGQ